MVDMVLNSQDLMRVQKLGLCSDDIIENFKIIVA